MVGLRAGVEGVDFGCLGLGLSAGVAGAVVVRRGLGAPRAGGKRRVGG